MTRQDFLLLLDELLELDPGTLNGSEVLADLEMWDSLAVISFIAMVDEKLGLIVAGDQLTRAKTIDDLMALVAEKVAA